MLWLWLLEGPKASIETYTLLATFILTIARPSHPQMDTQGQVVTVLQLASQKAAYLGVFPRTNYTC